MPNVKALITDLGTDLTTSYSPLPLCCPARANWLTGQYKALYEVLEGHLAAIGYTGPKSVAEGSEEH